MLLSQTAWAGRHVATGLCHDAEREGVAALPVDEAVLVAHGGFVMRSVVGSCCCGIRLGMKSSVRDQIGRSWRML